MSPLELKRAVLLCAVVLCVAALSAGSSALGSTPPPMLIAASPQSVSSGGVRIDANAPLSSSGYQSPSVSAASTFVLSCSDGANPPKSSSAAVSIIPIYQEI